MTTDPTDDSLFEAESPFALFARWFADAKEGEINDPNAMTIATADPDGLPDARMVLLKDWDEAGFVFYTNTESNKGRQLEANPKAAILFHWKSLRRQVRIRGLVTRVTEAEADAYFDSRARESRIGAWASQQSRPLEGRFALEKRVAEYGLKYALGHVPRPPYWSGYRVAPLRLEFWRDRPFRLHDRLVFERQDTESPWTSTRLFP